MEDQILLDVDLQAMSTGYIHHPPSIAAAQSLFPMSAAPSDIRGAAKASGVAYFNLALYEAAYLKEGDCVHTQRPIVDLGQEGRVLGLLYQATGICSGCSHAEGATKSAFATYVMTGTGYKPQEYSFAWAYLTGRDSQYVPGGDSGAIPSMTVQAYHDFGALPVGAFEELLGMVPHGPGSQEALCVQYRDNPRPMLDRMAPAAAPYKCRVYSPQDIWDIADSITTGRAVTFGCSYQANKPVPGSNGVSSLYLLGGHETCGDGWFLYGKGRLGLIKTESWGPVLPGTAYPNNRVTIMTDDGPRTLYPGQVAIDAESWLACRPECWSIDAPGSI